MRRPLALDNVEREQLHRCMISLGLIPLGAPPPAPLPHLSRCRGRSWMRALPRRLSEHERKILCAAMQRYERPLYDRA